MRPPYGNVFIISRRWQKCSDLHSDLFEINGRLAASDEKYARLLAKLPERPGQSHLQALSTDDLRFLVRRNGTPSHSLNKQPCVDALLRLIEAGELKPAGA